MPKDLIKRLLTHDRTKRYGCLKSGAEDIKKHKWYKGMDWDVMYNRGLPLCKSVGVQLGSFRETTRT